MWYKEYKILNKKQQAILVVNMSTGYNIHINMFLYKAKKPRTLSTRFIWCRQPESNRHGIATEGF